MNFSRLSKCQTPGPGIILLLEPMSDDIKIKIQFDNFGEKVLLLKYAKIRIIEEKS